MNYYLFEYPYLVLLLIPLLFCLYRCKEQIKSRYFVHLQFLSAKKSFFKLQWILKIIIFVLLCIALMSPVSIDKQNPFNRNGKDIVLAIDASGSMNASGFDVQNVLGERLSRFEIAKIVASEFIQKRVMDNIGVVIFGDFAFIASPVTYEKEIVSDMLGYLSQGMAGQNTAIGEAIAIGVRAFKYSSAQTKIIILLTDGEHNSGAISPKDAVKLAQENKIKVYTIALGNKGEADEALLKEMAKNTDGVFFEAKSAEELQEIYAEIDKLESSKIKSKEYREKDFHYQVFLLLACGFLLLLLFRGARK